MTSLITFDTEIGMEKIQELRLILKEKIGSKAITQISLAKATGVDQATISRFYKHSEGVSAENFIRLTEGIGGRIVWPGEDSPPSWEHAREIERLREKVESLTKENIVLHKLVNKYEAEEHEKKEETKNRETDTRKPILPACDGSQLGTEAG